jgi:hypothetical protein
MLILQKKQRNNKLLITCCAVIGQREMLNVLGENVQQLVCRNTANRDTCLSHGFYHFRITHFSNV